MEGRVAYFILVVVSVWQVRSAIKDCKSDVVDILPCSVRKGVVSRSDSITYSIVSNFSLCNDNETDRFVLRVSTWSSEADSDFPLVFVTRRGSAVDFWTIPFTPPDFSLAFDRVSRTLCQNNATDEQVYMDVFTSFPGNVTFNVIFEPVANYSLRQDEWYPIVVGASTPQVHMFTFPNGVETVTVQTEASSSRCAILSVQNISCPINDLLEDIKYIGHYQTMSTDGFLTVTRKTFSGDSFFIILITTNYSVCHSSDYVSQSPLIANGTVFGFDQIIRVIVRPLEAAPVLPILFPLFLFGAFYIALICIYFESRLALKCRWSPLCKWRFMKRDTVPADDADMRLTSTPPSYGTTNTSSGFGRTLTQDSLQLSVMEVNEGDLKLPHMCKNGYSTLQSQYTVYSWNTITVGIFYALPAFQLVLSQQLLANSSGEEDLCYYNFKCAHPVGLFNSFNNVWSNVGYLLLGFLFILVTFIRKRRYTALRYKNKIYADNHGIPPFYGIYYAMGLALILEGFMSSLYHICPTNANFQFDTAFMFIIAGLLLTKIFQSRHPDIHANAFIAFFSFAVVIFFTLLGIFYDHRNPVAVRCSLLMVVLIMAAGFFSSFYYFHRWQFSKEMFVKVFKTWKCFSCALLHRVRFFKLLGAFVINIIIAIVAIVGYSFLDFATTILTFFLVNVIIFVSAYVVTKLYYREPWTLLPMVLPVVIVALWGVALYFFLDAVSDWQRTPAESRALNRPCVLMEFYDSHDIWHFLSACALFFSFLYFMTLDDGIDDWERNNIQVF